MILLASLFLIAKLVLPENTMTKPLNQVANHALQENTTVKMPNQLVKVAARANTVRRLAQLQQPPVKIALQENILQPQLQQVPLRVKAVQLENMVQLLG